MRRRQALKSMGMLAGSAGLSRYLLGCGDNRPASDRMVVVALMMENRSYDHLLGARGLLEGKPGDGITVGMANPSASDEMVPLYAPNLAQLCVVDPPHGWTSSHAQWNGGLNDGFLREHQAEHPGDLSALQYLTRAEQPISWALADGGASCDRWYASVMGPTWPNRWYWLAGTSHGIKSNVMPQIDGDARTVFHQLGDAGVDARLYYGDVPFFPLLGNGIGSTLDLSSMLRPINEFFDDAAAGQLPPVVYIDPPFSFADDHPPHHPMLGQQFIESIYLALANSPHARNFLLVTTYDEHGGFFDHVVPPTTVDDWAGEGFDQLGFRVPGVLAGSYVRPGHVSSVVRDHTSMLRHLALTFGLGDLTTRAAEAAPLVDCLDVDRWEARDPLPPLELPSLNIEDWMIDEVCGNASARRVHDVLRAADAHPELVGRWDKRHERREIARDIRAQVARLRGRVKRFAVP